MSKWHTFFIKIQWVTQKEKDVLDCNPAKIKNKKVLPRIKGLLTIEKYHHSKHSWLYWNQDMIIFLFQTFKSLGSIYHTLTVLVKLEDLSKAKSHSVSWLISLPSLASECGLAIILFIHKYLFPSGQLCWLLAKCHFFNWKFLM